MTFDFRANQFWQELRDLEARHSVKLEIETGSETFTASEAVMLQLRAKLALRDMGEPVTLPPVVTEDAPVPEETDTFHNRMFPPEENHD